MEIPNNYIVVVLACTLCRHNCFHSKVYAEAGLYQKSTHQISECGHVQRDPTNKARVETEAFYTSRPGLHEKKVTTRIIFVSAVGTKNWRSLQKAISFSFQPLHARDTNSSEHTHITTNS